MCRTQGAYFSRDLSEYFSSFESRYLVNRRETELAQKEDETRGSTPFDVPNLHFKMISPF